MLNRTIAIPIFSLVIAGACGRAVAGSSGDIEPVAFEGKLIKTGTAEFVAMTLLMDDGSSYNVGGELIDELDNLSGIRVEVRAVEGQRRRLDVVDYSILSVNGMVPWVGDTFVTDGVRMLRTDTRGYRLRSASPSLASAGRMKIWVLGDESDGVITVQSWGLIKEYDQ